MRQHGRRHGEVRRGQLGIKIQDLTPDLASVFGLQEQKGALIAEVERGTPAEKAGLQSGDLITAINNKSVSSSTDVRNRIGLLRIGERVKITIIRRGRTRNLYAVIADIQRIDGGKISLYLKGTELTNSLDGVQVHKVSRGSNAWEVGFRAGDMIIGFNRREIKDAEDLARRFSRYKVYSIQIRRDGEVLSILLN